MFTIEISIVFTSHILLKFIYSSNVYHLGTVEYNGAIYTVQAKLDNLYELT